MGGVSAMADIWAAVGLKRPSEQLEDVMLGRAAYEDADASIQSLARMEFRRAAIEILSAPNNAEKRARLDRVPSYAKKYVEKEIRKILKNDTRDTP